MNSRRLRILLVVFVITLAPFSLCADTYDTHTLVAITVPKGEEPFLRACRIDVVGRRGEVYKALLTPEELALFAEKGFKIEILYEEMAEDRAIWAEADARAGMAGSYYTPSKFVTTGPPAGSLMEHLLQLYNAHPGITRLFDIGDSQDGAYDIIAMKVTKNPDVVEAEPKIRIYGNIHGDEKGGLMVACDVLDWILANYATNATAQKLVDEAELWFIPMGNPYGNANNSRDNGRGVDLNRNFWGPEGSDDGYPTAGPWTEKETQAIRDLTEALPHKKRFATSLSFHGGEICFNSVYNYTTAATTDEPIFFSSRTGGPEGEATPAPGGLAKAYQDGCTMPGFWYTNGGDWYKTWGDTNDWSYYQWSSLDTTLEATAIKTPPVSEIDTYCAQHRQAVLNYMMKTFQGVHGVMSDAETGAPLDGTVRATATSSAYTTVPHVYKDVFTDPAAGDFHRILQPGTYTVECMAPGYMTTTVAGVVVAADAKTNVNCAMGKTGLKLHASSLTETCSGTGTGGDGVLDPGEDGVLQVVVQNPGSVAATAVQATLTTSTPGVTIVRGTATFADVPGGGETASNAPHFGFRVGTAVPCGTTIEFAIHMTCTQGAWDESFTVFVGTPGSGSSTYAATDVPKAIPDNTTVQSSLNVAASGTVQDVNVTVGNLTHTYDGDLNLRLVGPDGTVVALSSQRGGGGDNFVSTVFDDEASASISTGSAPFTGSFKPESPLSALDGIAAAGTWKLEVQDTAGGDTGTLNGWSLTITATTAATCHPCTPMAPPGETAAGGTYATAQKWTGKTQHEWPGNDLATTYRLYRGTPGSLPSLLTSSADSCLRYEGAGTGVPVSEEPAAGTFFWYIVTGLNAGGEGSAGTATAGTRIPNGPAGCP